MDVIDRFRRISRFHEMRHVRLDRLRRDIGEFEIPESWHEVFLHDVPVVLLGRTLVLGFQDVR